MRLKSYLLGMVLFLAIPLGLEAQRSLEVTNLENFTFELPQVPDTIGVRLSWDYVFRGNNRMETYGIDVRGASTREALQNFDGPASGRFTILNGNVNANVAIGYTPRPTNGDSLFIRGRVRAVATNGQLGPWADSEIMVVYSELPPIPPPTGVVIDTISIASLDGESAEVIVRLPQAIVADPLYAGAVVNYYPALELPEGNVVTLQTRVDRFVGPGTGNVASETLSWYDWGQEVTYELVTSTDNFIISSELPTIPVVGYETFPPKLSRPNVYGFVAIGKCSDFNYNADYNNYLCNK